MNRQGKGFLEADDPKLPEIVVPEFATGTAFNGDRVLVRRDVRRKEDDRKARTKPPAK